VPDTEHTDCYELVLLNPEGTHVVLQEAGEAKSLPTVRIPRFTRPAEKITSLLRNDWSVRTTVLWSSAIESAPNVIYFAVLEAIDEIEQPPAGLKWFHIHEALTLIETSQAALIETSHARVLTICFGADPEPFSRLGWIHRLRAWINRTVQPFGTQLGEFVQLNGSATFSLVRFETSTKPLWFKAIGEPNLREFSITLLLYRLFPDYLPKILASDRLLNGWLMESGGESTLHDLEGLDIWIVAVQRLAHLQIESIPTVTKLLEAGCRDLRPEALSKVLAPFFDNMAGLMEQQTKSTPRPLTRQELSEVAATVKEALLLMAESGIPDTLGHSDFNPGNVLVDGERCVFTDWAEAHVGHPFLTFEYVLAHLRMSCPTLMMRENCLRQTYAECWRSIVCPTSIERALQLSPLIAVYACAISTNSWRDPKRLAPHVPGHLRSLTRRMRQEANELYERRDS
jgi:hypothetical protein